MRAANSCYKGERPEGYGVAHVTFDENKSDKLYAYWTPPGWDVHPGDKLLVMVSERSARKWTTVRSMEGLVPMGAEHKVAERHMPMPRERQLLKEMEAQRNVVDNDEWAPDMMDRDMQRNLQERYYRAMAVPPELLTPAKIRTLVENHAITLTQKEPTAMIKMETYLNGKLLSAHTDEELFAAIRKTEAEINSLRGIENKPKALKDRINTLQADIDGLVKYMDAR